MYWCNCLRSWEDQGHKITGNSFYIRELHVYKWQVVQTDKNHNCRHCNHAAFYSKKDPNESYETKPKKETTSECMEQDYSVWT